MMVVFIRSDIGSMIFGSQW